jgi:hypothetical protein
MPSIDTNRNRMLALIATVLATAALRASYPVTMPLTASILLIAAVWPLKLWLDRLARAERGAQARQSVLTCLRRRLDPEYCLAKRGRTCSRMPSRHAFNRHEMLRMPSHDRCRRGCIRPT